MKSHRKKKQQQQQAFVPELRKLQSHQSKALRKSQRYKAAQMKLVESEDDCIEDYFVKKNLRRGMKCWRKYERQFFKGINSKFLNEWKQNTTTNNILTFLSSLQQLTKSNTSRQNNFIISLYKTHFPDILNEQYIRVLFEKSQNMMIRRQSQVQSIIREMQNPSELLIPIEQQPFQYNCFHDKQYTLVSFEINQIIYEHQELGHQSNGEEPIKMQYQLQDFPISMQQQLNYEVIRNHGHLLQRYQDFGKNTPNIEQQFSQQFFSLANLDIQFRGSTNDVELINKIFEYERLVQSEQNQIERQLLCWQRQLDNITRQNQSLWQKAQQSLQMQNEYYDQLKKFYVDNCQMHCQSEVGNSNTTLTSTNNTLESNQLCYRTKQDQVVDKLQKYLFYSQILQYFQKGYCDKHNEMLQEIKQLIEINKVLASSQNPLKRHSSQHSEKKQQQDIFEEPKVNKQRKDFNLRYQFESDCKICFCTENLDANKVLYCEGCNTSFHQSCYGIKTLHFRKDDKFFCDSCLYLKLLEQDHKEQQQEEQQSFSKNEEKQEKLNDFLKFCLDNKNTQFYEQKILLLQKCKPQKYRKIVCKICFQPDFPLKNLDGHFYHVTCLILFNLAQIKDYRIKLKPNQTYETITQKVIDNELQNDYCQFCSQLPSCNKGMQFKCSWKGCKNTFHPICAYINGCKFEIQKKSHTLNVSVFCYEHFSRDNANQVYLRRFFCDYNKTSQLIEEEFREIYTMEEQERKSCISKRIEKQRIKKKQIEQITQKTKITNLYISKYTEKYIEWINDSIQRVVRQNKIIPEQQIKKMICSKVSETIRYKICHPRLPFIIEKVQRIKSKNNNHQPAVKKQNVQQFQQLVNTVEENLDAKSKDIIEEPEIGQKNQSQQTLKIPISFQNLNIKIEPQFSQIQKDITLIRIAKSQLKNQKKARKKQDSDYQPDSVEIVPKRGRKKQHNR